MQQSPVLAFLCAVAGNHSALVPLGSIKDDITTLLGNYSLSQIQVEVINGDHFYVPTLFPIRSATELAIAFHHLKDEIGFSTRLLEQNGNGFVRSTLAGIPVPPTQPLLLVFYPQQLQTGFSYKPT